MFVRINGGDTIGAASYEVNWRDYNYRQRRILIDCGVGVGDKRGEGPLDPTGPIDGIVETHSHDDHVMAIPGVMVDNPEAKHWISHAGIYQTNISWQDGLNVGKRNLAVLRRDPSKRQEMSILRNFLRRFEKGMDYALLDENLVEVQELKKRELFPGSGAFMTNGSSGHILGAMWVVLELHLSQGRVIRAGFTGDMTFQNRPTVRGTLISEFPPEQLDVLFVDATTGAGDIPQLSDEQEKMGADVARYIKEGRRVFISALSKGRVPDVAISLALRGIDVFVEGLGRETTRESLSDDGYWSSHDVRYGFAYEEPSRENGWFRSYRLNGARIRFVDTDEQREWLLHDPGGRVAIAPSGMGTGGRIVDFMI